MHIIFYLTVLLLDLFLKTGNKFWKLYVVTITGKQASRAINEVTVELRTCCRQESRGRSPFVGQRLGHPAKALRAEQHQVRPSQRG